MQVTREVRIDPDTFQPIRIYIVRVPIELMQSGKIPTEEEQEMLDCLTYLEHFRTDKPIKE